MSLHTYTSGRQRLFAANFMVILPFLIICFAVQDNMLNVSLSVFYIDLPLPYRTKLLSRSRLMVRCTVRAPWHSRLRSDSCRTLATCARHCRV